MRAGRWRAGWGGKGERAGLLLGRSGVRAGPPGKGEGEEGVGRLSAGLGLGRWFGLGLGLSCYFSGFLFHFKHHLNLFEFKLKFEFNSYAFKSNKIKPCTSMNATTI
jgi:hypothetical protein